MDIATLDLDQYFPFKLWMFPKVVYESSGRNNSFRPLVFEK